MVGLESIGQGPAEGFGREVVEDEAGALATDRVEELHGVGEAAHAFGGHAHRYSRSEVNGHVYYRLATTGGGSDLSGIANGQFDHLVWVTMADQGPQITNLMLDGIWGDDPVAEIGG